ncbi:hypothetical protein VaNZ11_015389 [Volvox africanus]|uniref:Uncharacterized protein n=1 Tax=Volvox africanus TaxID=51714 RepID=A0ABQ5SLD5_9CHLO|nr:hypothetical protein VaNZ11_015389 [Volvox africanus]
MSLARGRPGYADAALKGGDAPPGDGFGNEIERMLMDRPMTRQSFSGSPAPVSTSGPGNTLDELMAELGMLRGERGEGSLPDRQLGRNGTRSGPRMSATGDGSLLGGCTDGPLRPSTPRTNAASSAAMAGSGPPLVLPPAKGALAANPAAAAIVPAGPLGPGRSQSPMSTRRSVTGAINGASLSGTASPAGCSAPAAPPPGVLERQVQLETRLEKMELREQQLMALVSQLQQQVSTLSRAQHATQQQLANVAAAPHPAAPVAQSASATPLTLIPPAEGREQSPNRAAADAPRPAAATATPVSDEDFIQNDDGDSPTSSPRPRSAAAAAASGPQVPSPPQQLLQQQSQRLSTPIPPVTGSPGGGGGGVRPNNKLIPGHTGPAEWELDVSQLRKELGALAANVVRLRDHLATLVPGGPSPLSEEVSAQSATASQLKQNLTQIAMDVVSLHKGLTSLKHDTERNQTALEKSINDVQLQIQTNALNVFAAGPHPGTSWGTANGHPNAVATALAATGGVTGSLEESLRSAFAKPAMRSLPAFNTADLGFMPDNGGAAAAVSAFGGLGAATGGGGGGRNNYAPANGGGGGLGAALALLNSFEEQAAAEQAEQQKAAIIARQAVSIVDAKVKQVIIHVDRHMQIISSDVEERLKMYEQTIIRMAQQIDRVQRALKDIEGTAVSRIVVRQGGKDVDEGAAGGEVAPKKEPQVEEVPPTNWVKAAAMANGRFVPQKVEDKKPLTKNTAHGYFRTPP